LTSEVAETAPGVISVVSTPTTTESTIVRSFESKISRPSTAGSGDLPRLLVVVVVVVEEACTSAGESP